MSELKAEDLRIFSWSSKHQGSWSMSVPNGVHIIHIPTGIESKVDSERSQYKNKDLALKEISTKLEKGE